VLDPIGNGEATSAETRIEVLRISLIVSPAIGIGPILLLAESTIGCGTKAHIGSIEALGDLDHAVSRRRSLRRHVPGGVWIAGRLNVDFERSVLRSLVVVFGPDEADVLASGIDRHFVIGAVWCLLLGITTDSVFRTLDPMIAGILLSKSSIIANREVLATRRGTDR
jgi:hypothetical protein